MLKFFIADFCRFYIFIIFSVGVYGKFRSFEVFAQSVETTFGFSETLKQHHLAKYLSCLVILIEALVSVLLLFGGPITGIGMGAAAMLTTLFTVVIIRIVLQKRLVRCHCFGPSSHEITWLDLVRNKLIILVCGTYFVFANANQEASTIQPKILTDIILFGLAIIFFNFTANLRELRFLMRRPSIN